MTPPQAGYETAGRQRRVRGRISCRRVVLAAGLGL